MKPSERLQNYLCDVVPADLIAKVRATESERDKYRAALELAKAELGALWSFCGQNLEVFNWHQNGAGEPLDNFFDDNDHGARAAIKGALET